MTMLSRFATLGGGIPDPYWSSVTLLLTGNNLLDSSSSPKTMVNNGPVATTVSTSVKQFGSGSLLFAGTSISNYAKLATSYTGFGTSNFTLEFWVYFATSTADQYAFDSRASFGASNGFALLYNDPATPNKLAIYYGSGFLLTPTISITSSGWYFVALCRQSNTLTMYVNGNSAGTATLSADLNSTIYRFGSGNDNYPAVNCYLDDVRITQGVARYSGSTCPVPTAPFPTFGP